MDDLCRLCLCGAKLINVFSESLQEPAELRRIISVMVSVDIKEHDQISKKICLPCCSIILKMYRFRKFAISANEALKDRRQSLKSLDNVHNKNKVVHGTVRELTKEYPEIVLPAEVFNCNIKPCISLNTLDPSYVESSAKARTENEWYNIFTKNKENTQHFANKSDEVVDGGRNRSKSRPKRRSTPINDNADVLPPQKKAKISKEPSATNVIQENPDESVDFPGEASLPVLSRTYECQVCSKSFPSEHQLEYHLKLHMACKVCKLRFRGLKDMLRHFANKCVKANNSVVVLERIEEDHRILEKYKTAFDDARAELEETSSIEIISLNDECIYISDSDNEADANIDAKPEAINTDTTQVPASLVKLEEPPSCEFIYDPIEKTEDISITDDQKMPIFESVSTIHPKVLLINEDDQLFEPPVHLNEEELLKSLFAYNQTSEVATQTQQQVVRCKVKSNVILLENIAPELYRYKIPITLKVDSKISASLVQKEPDSTKATKLFSWQHIKPIDIISPNKPKSVPNGILPPPIILNKHAPKMVSNMNVTHPITFKILSKPVTTELPYSTPSSIQNLAQGTPAYASDCAKTKPNTVPSVNNHPSILNLDANSLSNVVPPLILLVPTSSDMPEIAQSTVIAPEVEVLPSTSGCASDETNKPTIRVKQPWELNAIL